MTTAQRVVDTPLPTQTDPCNGVNVAPSPTSPSPPPPSLDERLKEICSQLKRGVQPQRETVRSLLGWIGVSRRGFNVNSDLRSKLAAVGLKTEPDFEFAYIDSDISFVFAPADDGEPGQGPSYRIGQLPAANKKPVSVTLDDALTQAITLMLKNNYSQLPVMANTRDVKGVVTWKSIGTRLALKVKCSSMRDYMEPAQIVSTEESFFSVLEIISKHGYVLVCGKDKNISGIVTASDFNDQFRKMAEPFLLVGEIENGIRNILSGHFTGRELEAAKAPSVENRKISGVADLTFGEYVRLLGTDPAWQKVGLHIDKSKFVCWLDQVRDVRNNVMHFNPDGLEENDLLRLQEFAEFLKCLRDAGAL